jgi:hypothetical protein
MNERRASITKKELNQILLKNLISITMNTEKELEIIAVT